MYSNFFSSQIVALFSILFTITFLDSALSQNYWERTSGPGTVLVYDFLFKDDFILLGSWHGGIYKSTDGGATWQQIENEFVGKSVYSLELLSNGNILAGTADGIHISSDNGETWFHSALTDYLVSTITIDESGSIYVGSVYENDIYRSTDNGISWNPLNSGITSVRAIQIKESNKILVAAGGNIFRSSDSGNSWAKVFPVTYTTTINDLALNQSGNFSAISDFGVFFLSTDEGISWDSVSTINRSSRIIHSSSNGDLYLGSYVVYRSTNEGQNWVQLNGFQGCGLIRSIAELDNSFYAGTYFSGVFRSIDSGNNWGQSSKGINTSTVSLLAKDFNGKVFAVSAPAGHSITTDNGENWEIIPASSFNHLSASPNGSLFGSMPGSIGIIFRSIDGGYSWEIVYQGTDFTYIQSVAVSPNETVFAIINGKLNRSTDNGNDWDTIQIASQYESLTKININSQGFLFTKISEGYFRSSDNGESWVQLTSIPEGLEIFGITNLDEMYASAADSGYYRSTNYGDTWNYIYKGNGRPVKSFADNNVGYLFIVVQDAGVLRSIDNGFSWQELNSGLEGTSLSCLIITDDDYLLGGTSWKGVYRSVNKTTSVENKFIQLPQVFSLEQNFPNPFNPITKIRYQVSGNSRVYLRVFDVLGKEIATLVNEVKPEGFYEIEFDGTKLSSGIYFYQLKSENFFETRKMILLK